MQKFEGKLSIIFLVFLCFTPLIWFWGKDGMVINGVDTNFPLDPLTWFLRRFFVWNPVTNGGSDFSSSTAGLFFHFIQVVPYYISHNLQITQVFSLVFWFSMIVLNAFWLSKTIFPKSKLIQFLFTTLYAHNIYLFNTWENVKVSNLALVVGLPLGINILILLEQKKISYKTAAILSVFLGIILSGSGINPAYFLTFFGGLFIYLVGKNLFFESLQSLGWQLKDLIVVSIIVVFINLFWILPSLNYILSNISFSEDLTKLGYTNWVSSLSENTSLLNVFRLQGAWDWYAVDSATGDPYYIPYAVNYFYNFSFVIFSFIITGLIILSLVFVDKRNRGLYSSFLLLYLFSIFLEAGTHHPTGIFFSFLSLHIPFFSFFRSPWYIFTPLTTLSIAVLVSLLFYRLRENEKLLSERKWLLSGGLILMIVGNLLYNYPLILGSIFREHREDSFYIKFPDYLFESTRWLSSHQDGRLITYPNDEIERFSWGYRGVEPVTTLLMDNEVAYIALNSSTAPISKVIQEYYKNLKTNRLDSASSISAKLNIKYLLNKDDQLSMVPNLPAGVQELGKEEFGKWIFYNLPQNSNESKIFSAKNLYSATPYEDSYLTLGFLEKDSLIVNPDDSVIKSIEINPNLLGKVILASNSHLEEYRKFALEPFNTSSKILHRDLSSITYTFDIEEDGEFSPIIDRSNIENFGFGLNKPIPGNLNNNPINLNIIKSDDSYLYFESIKLQKGSYSLTLNLQLENLIKGGDFSGDNLFEKAGATKDQGVYGIVKDNGNQYLSILNLTPRDISADFYVDKFDPSSIYYLDVNYRHIYGNYANVYASQVNGMGFLKTQRESLPDYPEWHNFNFFFPPELTDSILKINLVAPGMKDSLGTKVLYDDLKVHRLFSNNLFLLKRGEQLLMKPVVSFKKSSSVLYKGKVMGGNEPHIIVFAENYSPLWELSISDLEGNEISAESKHFSGDYYANAWFVSGTPNNYNFTIFYKPQNLFWRGGIISIITIVFILIFNVYFWFKKLKPKLKI